MRTTTTLRDVEMTLQLLTAAAQWRSRSACDGHF